jgi:hypothetical protein
MTFLYNLYFVISNNERLDSVYERIIIKLFNIFSPVYYFATSFRKRYSIQSSKSDHLPAIVVSLTSYPFRIKKTWLIIESIMHQEVKPQKLILWLFNGEFGNKEALPRRLLSMQKRGLEIRLFDYNLMPHKKYFNTMLEFSGSIVVTIDDDIYYPHNFLKKLIDLNRVYPQSICCTTARRIKIANNQISTYTDWKYLKSNNPPTHGIHFVGAGGILFPPGSLHKDVFNKDDLIRFALCADDLWLKIMSLKNDTKIACMAGEYSRFFIPVIRKNDTSLTDLNIGKGHNDVIFKNLIEYYNIPISIFSE